MAQQQAGLAVDEEHLGHLEGQRLPQGHLGAGDATHPRPQSPPHDLGTKRGAHLSIYGAGQVPDGLRHGADDGLPDDGVERLDHLVAGVADLAADGVAQHRGDYADQRVFVADAPLQVVQFRL